LKQFELFIERTLLASRWLLVVFYAGLGAALGVYALSFVGKLLKVASGVFGMTDADVILSMLGLIDAALVASLLVMVMVSGYENFVSRFDEDRGELSWLGKLDAGSLKIKIASSIVAISSIHLLQVFMNLPSYDDMDVLWSTVLHMTFVASALLLGVLDRMSSKAKGH